MNKKTKKTSPPKNKPTLIGNQDISNLEKTQALKSQLDNDSPTPAKIFLKAAFLSLLFAFIMLLITGIGFAIWSYFKISSFAQSAETSIPELRQLIQEGIETQPTSTNGKKNILLLGTDSLETRPGSPELTDTMMLISIDLNSGQINTLSLPRDLYSQAYQTKINALYFYGKERHPENPTQFPREVIEDLTEIEIHHAIVISLEQVANIIDILEDIEVEVETGFTDEQFPRTDVDVTVVRDPELLYQTVTFESGRQTMDSQKALQFIRSRYSGDDQGTDISRSERQQLVISSMMEKLNSLSPIRDSNIFANLFISYKSDFNSQLPLTEIIASGKKLMPARNEIKIKTNSLSVHPEDPNGVITNPPTYLYNNQWVYEIIDLDQFIMEVQKKLSIR